MSAGCISLVRKDKVYEMDKGKSHSEIGGTQR